MPLFGTCTAGRPDGRSGTRARARALGRIISALCLGALLAACSTVRLGYEQVPTLGYWWLDRHFDFDGTQSPQVRAALSQWQAEHRREELPRLQALIAEAQTLAAGEISAEQACRFGEAVRTRVRAAAALAEAPAARIALTLGPAQTDALARKQADTNDEFRLDWLARSPAQQQTRRYDEQRKRYEDFYGRLSDAQRAQLRQSVAASRFDVALLVAPR
ncbi:MAG: hypothetical protein EOO24_14510, partial [Comamonadaceae bacterium]